MRRQTLIAAWRNAPVTTPALLMAATLGWASPSMAQTAAASEAASDEIVVTAQRREESLLDVPISIVALGNEELTNRNITEASRLEQVAPGLQIGRSGTDPRPAIRGTYTESIQGNADPRIGFYIDEIYQSRTSQLSLPFVDLARVEVQKGPQGTLYGRNSFGGNIALVTNLPNDKFEGGFDVLAGNYDRVMATGYVNLPISERFAARFAGAFEQRDGYIKSLTTPSADYDDKGTSYLRGALRWTSPDERVEVVIRGTYWHEDSAGAGTFNAKAIGQFIDPNLVTAPGGTLNLGNATFTFPLGFNGRTFAGQFVPYSAFRDGRPDINGADIGILIPGPYKALNDTPSFAKITSYQGSATISWEMSDQIRFRSITGYTDFSAFRGGDNDGTSAPFGIGYFITENKSFSQELQLQSNDTGSPFAYTVGGFFLDDKVPDAFLGARVIPSGNYTTANAIATGQVPLYFGSNFTTLPNLPAANITAGSDAYNPLSYQHTKTYALYGQASYTINDRLTLTGGLRYTIDKKDFQSALGNRFAPAGTVLVFKPTTDFNRQCDGFTAADPSSTAPALTIQEALITRCGNRTFKYFTYRGSVDYKISDDLLLYASYSTGKHSGGFSYSVIPGTANNELPFYDTESVEAYELGLKGSILDKTVQFSLAAFYNQYNNLQVQTSFANPNVANSVVTVAGNGAQTKAPGVELEVTARPTEKLRLNLAINYLRARDEPFPVAVTNNGICDIVAAGGTCTTRPEVRLGFGGGITPNPVSNPELFIPILGANGQQLVVGGIPQFRSLGYGVKTKVQNQADLTFRVGLAYDFDLGSSGTLTPEIATYYNDGYILNRILVNFKQKSYTKTEIRVTWQNEAEDVSVQAFVENLENEATIGRATVSNGGAFSGTYAPPRTWGVRVGYRF